MSWLDIFKKRSADADFSKETIESIFEFHETNPLAGLGTLTVRARVIDDLQAQHALVVAKYRGITPRQPAPALREPLSAVEPPLELKAAQLAKKAGM